MRIDRQGSSRGSEREREGERGGGQTWGRAEAFLGARIGHVDAPGICKEGNPSQRAHSVHNQQGAVALAQLTQPF